MESAGSAMNMLFADVAQEVFSFLESAGFKLVERGSARLQYETDRSVVIVEWDNRSGEINVFIGLQPKKGEQQEAFSLSDLLNMQNVEVPERKMPFQIADEKRLAPFLKKLSEEMLFYAQPALAGDRMFFRRLAAFRSTQSQTHMRAMKLRKLRSEADKAWANRDFDKLISLYTLVEDDLSESEKRKLDYARKHQ